MDEMKSMYAAVWEPILRLRFWLELVMAIVLLIAFVITVVKYRNKSERRPYVISAQVGILSLMLGNLYTVVMFCSQNDFIGTFNPTVLGRLGGMAFMFLATRQSIYVTGERPRYTVASNVISAVVSIALCAVSLYLVIAFEGALAPDVIYGIEVVLLSLGVFFNLRVGLAPNDSEASKGVRPLNFNFAIYSIFSVVYIVLVYRVYDNMVLEYPLIVATVFCVASLINIPFNLTRGLK